MGENRNRANSLHLRLSDTELDRLQKRSAEAGLKPQAYIHALVNGQQVKQRPSFSDVQILNTLQQINNSMYQIALKTSFQNSVTNNYKRENAYFFCSGYRKNTANCSAHYIREKLLYELVLESMKLVLSYVQAFEKQFVRAQFERSSEE